ncbi:MAG: DUF2807 domain-containing protein [Flavobacteriaceae bacterium]|nr:DUF2807 domain-containing protein [Flavobacteriaceae bacterium]
MKVKKILIIFIGVLLLSCDKENANDCFQKTGAIISQEITVANFTKIKVNRDVELILKEGAVQKVVLETGGNLLNDVSAVVNGNQLVLTDNNTCNYVRDYNVTKVYVTSPNITEIISSTQFQISSDGILSYPSIKISSEDYSDPSIIAVGEMNLLLNSQNVKVVGNNLTSFVLSGVAENLEVYFYAGDGVFNGASLIANEVTVFHRGTNNIIVNPQNELKGKLVSTGDLISVNQPPIVDVEVLYTGSLIFQ